MGLDDPTVGSPLYSLEYSYSVTKACQTLERQSYQ